MIRGVKLVGDWKSWQSGLQRFIDDVSASLAGVQDALPAMMITREFLWNTTLTTVDVSLGVSARPKGIIVLRAWEDGTENNQSGNAISWTWRSGYAKISAISGLTSATNYRVTLGVIT